MKAEGDDPTSLSLPTTPSFFQFIKTHPTDWDPKSIQIPINVRLDGCIVPISSGPQSARVSFSHVVVIDDLVEAPLRQELLAYLVGSSSSSSSSSTLSMPLPSDIWERRTTDMVGGTPTWGLKPDALQRLATGQACPAIIEIQSRLQKMYPEYRIAHLPSSIIQQQQQQEHECREDEKEVLPHKNTVDCSAFLVNAAVYGDTYRFHVDADPTSFPSPSAWTEAYGDYFNGEPGKPLLVSFLVYLTDNNEEINGDDWDRDWGGETLFLDGATDAGIFVRPRAGRVVLMHQDVLHKMSPPSSLAGPRRRFSIVWKLAFLPSKDNVDSEVEISRREWGRPSAIGSAARVLQVQRQLLLHELHNNNTNNIE